MKTIFAMFILLQGCLISCQSQAQSGTVDPREFSQQLQKTKDPVILDVRTPEEFSNGHIEGAVLMNYYEDDFATRLKKLDKEKSYFLYCAAGGRSNAVLQDMQRAGFKKVYELQGGCDAWQEQKLPLILPDDK